MLSGLGVVSVHVEAPSSRTASESSLGSLTRFADTGVPLPLVGTAAVGGARRRDARVADITANLYFDRP